DALGLMRRKQSNQYDILAHQCEFIRFGGAHLEHDLRLAIQLPGIGNNTCAGSPVFLVRYARAPTRARLYQNDMQTFGGKFLDRLRRGGNPGLFPTGLCRYSYMHEYLPLSFLYAPRSVAR